jgi:hypothetical protein
MRIRRRRNELQPVVLPSLDRLSGLIERVVELVDAVGDAKAKPEPEPVVEAPREPVREPEPEPKPEPEPEPAGRPAAAGWVAFVSSAHGYRLVEATGLTPRLGEQVELEGGTFRVVKVGRSPLPGDLRRCAFLEGEEPREEGRKGDA